MVKTKSFDLYEYDYNNLDLRSTLIKLSNDDSTKMFLGNLQIFIENVRKNFDPYSEVYIAYYHDNPIGLVSLNFLDSVYEICYAILPEMREKGFASSLLKEYTEYIFENTNIEELYLYINTANKVSAIVARNSGYERSRGIEYKRSKK